MFPPFLKVSLIMFTKRLTATLPVLLSRCWGRGRIHAEMEILTREYIKRVEKGKKYEYRVSKRTQHELSES